MKTSTIAVVLATAAHSAHGQWWGGAPDCAQGCFSSLWDSASAWPAPTSYCSATQASSVHGCIVAACSATPTAVTSYSSLSSSLCSQWASCSADGSTGVYTVSAPAFTGAWGPGQYGGPGGRGGHGRWGANNGNGYDHDGDGDVDQDDYTQWTGTWTGGVYTVTGCEWNGNPWAGGPGGWGYGHGSGPGGPWAPWGKGWSWTTATQTVTAVVTGADNSVTTSVGLATVAQAASGSYTTTSLVTGLQAQQTSPPAASGGAAGPQEGAAAGGAENMLAVKVMAAVLGGGLVVVGWL